MSLQDLYVTVVIGTPLLCIVFVWIWLHYKAVLFAWEDLKVFVKKSAWNWWFVVICAINFATSSAQFVEKVVDFFLKHK